MFLKITNYKIGEYISGCWGYEWRGKVGIAIKSSWESSVSGLWWLLYKSTCMIRLLGNIHSQMLDVKVVKSDWSMHILPGSISCCYIVFELCKMVAFGRTGCSVSEPLCIFSTFLWIYNYFKISLKQINEEEYWHHVPMGLLELHLYLHLSFVVFT